MRTIHDASCLAIVSKGVLLTAVYALLGTASLPALATEISDAAGDASGGKNDVIAIEGTYDSVNLYLSARFVPETFDAATLSFLFGIDTDSNPFTGLPDTPERDFPLGAEFMVAFTEGLGTGSTHASLNNALTGEALQLVPLRIQDATITVTVPLSALDNDDGIVNFGFLVGSLTGSTLEPEDVVPDSAWGGALVGPTTKREGPPILTIRVSEVEISWSSKLGKSYQVEYRESLEDSEWLALGSPLQGTGESLSAKDTVEPGSLQRLYRVTETP